MSSIALQVEEPVAILFQSLPDYKKEFYRQMFINFLTNKFTLSEVQSKIDFLRLMHEIGTEAQANGMTEEILAEILADEN